MAVADNLAGVVDQFYQNHGNYTLASSWLATFMFTFQVYYDFFGYSLMAQGAGLLFGIDLMDNFNKPFLAGSVPEFWHRWHISLSTWFRDYIFIPVGGNRSGKLILSFSVLLVFFTSGLWHGANSTMIYFGLSQGILYLFDRFVVGRRGSENPYGLFLRRLKTGFFFMMTLVFFRGQSLDQSFDVYSMLIGNYDYTQKSLMHLTAEGQVWLFLFVGFVFDHFIMKKRADQWFGDQSLFLRWIVYLFMLTAVLLFGGAVNHPFVYFQF